AHHQRQLVRRRLLLMHSPGPHRCALLPPRTTATAAAPAAPASAGDPPRPASSRASARTAASPPTPHRSSRTAPDRSQRPGARSAGTPPRFPSWPRLPSLVYIQSYTSERESQEGAFVTARDAERRRAGAGRFPPARKNRIAGAFAALVRCMAG